MSDLTKQVGDNVGGYHSLEIVSTDMIVTFPAAKDYVISSNIDLDGFMTVVKSTLESIEPNDGDKDSDKGEFNEHSIKFFHPIENETTLAWLRLWKTKLIVAKLKTNNGKVKIYGTPTNPLRLTYKLISKSGFSSRPGYEVTLSGLNTDPSLFFTGAINNINT